MQGEFSRALLSTARPVPSCIEGARRGRAERRFAVYRNNVVAGLVAALATQFPVVQRLVGEEFFRALGGTYVVRHPPRSPLLIRYGAGFADFIAAFPPAEPLPYLGDVARLEYARTLAYHAADAEPLPLQDFAVITADNIGHARVRLHPSVSILTSAHPVVSIWEAHLAGEVSSIAASGTEAALVSRPFAEVDVVRLPGASARFLQGLQVGMTIAGAAEAAIESGTPLDIPGAMATLFESRIVVAMKIEG